MKRIRAWWADRKAKKEAAKKTQEAAEMARWLLEIGVSPGVVDAFFKDQLRSTQDPS